MSNNDRERFKTFVHGLLKSQRETEVVGDALHACYVNSKEYGQAFSFLGNEECHTDGVLHSGRTYKRLLKEGFFIQAKGPVKEFKKLPKEVLVDAEGWVSLAYVSRTLAAKLIEQLKRQGKEISALSGGVR